MLRAGEKLAHCGNSGRSPVPHLHFHLQGTPEPGSPTIKANLVNYIIKSNSPPTFSHSGIPKKDEAIVSLQPEPRLQDMLHFKVNDRYTFKVTDYSGKTFNESWITQVDFWCNLSIVSDRGTRGGFSIYNGIFSIDGKVNLNLANYRNLIWNTRCVFHPEKGVTEIEITGPGKSKVEAQKMEEDWESRRRE